MLWKRCCRTWGFYEEIGGSESQTRQNSFISSGLPREILAYVSSGGKGRPMAMLFCRKWAITSRIGRPVLIITKFAEGGIAVSLRPADCLMNSLRSAALRVCANL